jgi:hypothetical protein
VQGNLHETVTANAKPAIIGGRPIDLDCIAPASCAHTHAPRDTPRKLAYPKVTSVWWYLVGAILLTPNVGCDG